MTALPSPKTGSRTAAPARPRRLRQFVPPQHGAWAMLLLPYVSAVAVTGPRWPDLPLLVAWLAGYLASYYAMQSVKTGRVRRVRDQLLLYGTVAASLAAVVVAARPAVLLFAPAYAALIGVNLTYARRRRERALPNDLASVVESCLMVFLVATVAGVPSRAVAGVFAVVLAYLVGTVLYVKTMIRERGNSTFRRICVGYHVAALALVGWLGPFVAAAFTLLLARAWLVPTRRLTPKQVGLAEIAGCVLVLAAVVLTWG